MIVIHKNNVHNMQYNNELHSILMYFGLDNMTTLELKQSKDLTKFLLMNDRCIKMTSVEAHCSRDKRTAIRGCSIVTSK